MAVKLLISGLSNSGKTTLVKDLKDALVINHDGKAFSMAIPNATIPDFTSSSELIDFTTEKLEAYKDKFGSYPDTIVFDSVSRVFNTLSDSCDKKFSGFTIYTELNKEIKLFNDFIENSLIASDMNVVIISHAIYDADTAHYSLVAQGNFKKIGGFMSVVDEAVFIETKSNKRILHYKSTKFPARTLDDSLPDFTNVDEFNLQQHIELLAEKSKKAAEYAL